MRAVDVAGVRAAAVAKARAGGLVTLLGRERPRRPALVAVVVAAAIAGVLTARTSFFFADDFLFGSFFVHNELTPALLFRSYFGHLVPVSALFQWVFYNAVGLNWAVAATFMVILLVAGAVAVMHLVDAVVGPRWVSALAGLAFALSAGVLALVSWWGATLGNLVPLVASISFLGAVSRLHTTGRARHLVHALLVYAFAVLFYEKALLFSAYAVLWMVLVLDAGYPFRDRVRRLLRRWPLWLGVAVVSAAVCVVYVLGPYRAEGGSTPPPGLAAGFIVRGVVLGLVPSVFGLDLQQPIWDGWVLPLALVANALVLAFVVWTVARARATLGVWLFVAVSILLGEVPLAIGRAELVGVDGGRLLRYQIEGTLFLLLGAAVALDHVRRAPRARARAAAPLVRVAVAALASVGLVLSGAAWARTIDREIDANPGTAARHWIDAFRAQWPTDRTVTLVDGPVPANVVFDWSYPYNLASYALPQLVDNATFTTSTADAWVLGPDGLPGPFAFDATVTVPVDECSVDGQGIVVPVDDTSTGQRQVLVTYRAEGTGEVTIAAGVAGALGDTSGLSPRFEARPGTDGFVLTVRPGTRLDTVSVASAAPGFCVESVAVGAATVPR